MSNLIDTPSVAFPVHYDSEDMLISMLHCSTAFYLLSFAAPALLVLKHGSHGRSRNIFASR